MKILVPVKRVIDYAIKIRVRPDKLGVDKASVKMSINPFCEIAVEEAVRLKEAKIATEIIAVSIGPKKTEETLRTALALGCDRGIHLSTDEEIDTQFQSLAVAKALAHIAAEEKPDLILTGKQSIDGDASQTAPMLASILGWPQATFASSINVAEDKQSAQVTREVDAGLQTLNVPLPAVISADLRLNEPRYATLPNIMKARKKKLQSIDVNSLGLDLAPRLKVLSVDDPPVRAGGVKVENVDELLEKLRTEKKVI